MNRRGFLTAAGAGGVLPLLAASPAIASPEERFARLLAEMTPSEFEALVEELEARKHAAEDPHPQWLKDWRVVQPAWVDATMSDNKDPMEDSLYQQMNAIEKSISRTPANTIHGIEAQVQWMLEDCDGDYVYPEHQRTHHSILKGLQELKAMRGAA